MINSLQSIRFIFALMIFHHHFFMTPQVVQFGSFPVSFFFILSGFVMTIGYGDKVLLESFSYKQYILKRLIRIFPLNAICLMLSLLIPVAADIFSSHLTTSNYSLFLPDLLMIQAWFPYESIYFSGNAVAWFLSDMLFFYLLFPFLIKILRRKLGYALMIFIIICYFVLVSDIDGGKIHYYIYICPLLRIVDFIMGIVLCQLLKNIKVLDKNQLLGTIFELFALSVCFWAVWAFPNVPIEYGYSSFFWIPSVLLITAFYLSSKWGGADFFVLISTDICLSWGIKFPLLYVTQNPYKLVSYNRTKIAFK